jgi:hypothetical protein
MNKPKQYVIKFDGQEFICKSKPELNMTLSKLCSGIGKIYGKQIVLIITEANNDLTKL